MVTRALSAAIALAACGDNLTHPAPAGPLAACLPDLDGQITAGELAPRPGAAAVYAVSPAGQTRAVDLAGEVTSDGALLWDFSTAPADPLVSLAAAPLAGRWYADAFPGGETVVPLDATGALEAVYAHDDDALWLYGIASADADPPGGRTLLPYDAPVALFRFPLAPGRSWISIGVVTGGTLLGLPYTGEDEYSVDVDAGGELALPEWSFTQALRARVRVEVRPAAGPASSRRQVSFLFECFGEVARATSAPGEPEEDFTTAAELRRLVLANPEDVP